MGRGWWWRQTWRPRSRFSMRAGAAKKIRLFLSGNEVYYTASSLLVIFKNSCSKFHFQKGFDYSLFLLLKCFGRQRVVVAADGASALAFLHEGRTGAGASTTAQSQDTQRGGRSNPRRALHGGISKVNFEQSCQLLSICAPKMAPRTSQGLQERAWDAPT